MDLSEVPASKNLGPSSENKTSHTLTEDGKALLYPSMWASFGICWNTELFSPGALFVEVTGTPLRIVQGGATIS